MADPIKAPINYAVSAGGQFVKGGSVVFGFENLRPDADNPATLKPVYLDSALLLEAANPQGLSSDAVFDQSDNGVLYGADADVYSVIIYDSNDVELSYIPSYDLSDANSALSAQSAADAAAISESNAQAAEANTVLLYTDFVNRYFGPFASDPTLDDEGNPPNEGSLYWNTVSARFKIYSSGVWIFPTDLALGTAAYEDIGTAPNQIPLNSDLPTFGTAAEANTGLLTGNVPTADDLSMVGETVNYTGANLNPNDFKCSSVDARFFMGFAASASVALFFAPVSFNATPSSISVTSTFSVKDASSSTVAGGGSVTPTLDSASSFKNALIIVSGLSGLLIGQQLQLTSTDATSRILVNI